MTSRILARNLCNFLKSSPAGLHRIRVCQLSTTQLRLSGEYLARIKLEVLKMPNFVKLRPKFVLLLNMVFLKSPLSPHLAWPEILFSQKHEWVRVDGNIGTVGVSHYAQESLGDVVYVLSPEIGTELEQNGKNREA